MVSFLCPIPFYFYFSKREGLLGKADEKWGGTSHGNPAFGISHHHRLQTVFLICLHAEREMTIFVSLGIHQCLAIPAQHDAGIIEPLPGEGVDNLSIDCLLGMAVTGHDES